MAAGTMGTKSQRQRFRRSSLAWRESKVGKFVWKRHAARERGQIKNLSLLAELAEISRRKSLKSLQLDDCSMRFTWLYPKIDIKDIAIEDKGKLRIEGAISVERRILRGTIQLGFTRRYLDWLPQAEEVFNRQRNGYLWTTVHLSGTIDEPGQDLSPRIIELFQQSPGAYLQLLFRQFGDWLKKTLGGD